MTPEGHDLGVRHTVEILGAIPLFDGPPERCPTCREVISPLALALGLGLEGDALSCDRCGAVLAA